MLKNMRGLVQVTNFRIPESPPPDNDEDRLFRDLWLWRSMNSAVNSILPNLGNYIAPLIDKKDDISRCNIPFPNGVV